MNGFLSIGLFGRTRTAPRPISALEQLEPRVMMSGTTMPTDDMALHWPLESIVSDKTEDIADYDLEGDIDGDVAISDGAGAFGNAA